MYRTLNIGHIKQQFDRFLFYIANTGLNTLMIENVPINETVKLTRGGRTWNAAKRSFKRNINFLRLAKIIKKPYGEKGRVFKLENSAP